MQSEISKQWQLADHTAEQYQKVLVPAILGPFAKALVDWARLPPTGSVIDIGCGTGAAARYAAVKVGRSGKLIGTDVNAAMLRVAQSLPLVDGAAIEWRQASADNLPVESGSIDVVLCAQTLQFIANRHAVLTEMHRILKHEQSAYLSLWCSITENPYFDALVSTIRETIGEDTAVGLGAAFALSDAQEIHDLILGAGFTDLEMRVSQSALDLPAVAEFVPEHIDATPMATGYQNASQATRDVILERLSERLAGYQTGTGIRVLFQSYLIKAVKP